MGEADVSPKRALIVDDSKSARVVLSRMLENYGLAVDSRESAEGAIEYLKSQRPDVIFLDHLMSGMDGFQAVQAIKADPGTATIPIMMYTSQEGELYVGQARALGALGVIPKQVAPVDVSKVLYQLDLLPDRRDPRPGVLQPLLARATGAHEADGAPPPPTGTLPPAIPLPPLTSADVRAIVEPALKDQSTELRRFVVASLDSLATRVLAETRELARSMAPPPAPEPAPAPPPPPARKPVAWIALAAVGSAAALATGVLAWQQHGLLRALEARIAGDAARVAATGGASAGMAAGGGGAASPGLAASPAAVTVGEAAAPEAAGLGAVDATAASGAGAAANAGAAASVPPVATPAARALPSVPRLPPVPYGEAPLAGTRLEPVRTLFAELEREGWAGIVRVTTHTGDFCLTGNATDGYDLAPAEMPANRCDLVGNPYDDTLRPAQHQSIGFVNLLAETRARSGGRLEVVVEHAARTRPVVAYPTGPEATASAWNTAAGANNRVELALEPHEPTG